MNSLENYNDLPDGLRSEEVNRLTKICLSESSHEDNSITLRKLWHLGVHQYHTYELPPDDARGRLSLWIAENNARWSDEDLVKALAVAIMYGLEKGLFRSLLERCPDDRKLEFETTLAASQISDLLNSVM